MPCGRRPHPEWQASCAPRCTALASPLTAGPRSPAPGGRSGWGGGTETERAPQTPRFTLRFPLLLSSPLRRVPPPTHHSPKPGTAPAPLCHRDKERRTRPQDQSQARGHECVSRAREGWVGVGGAHGAREARLAATGQGRPRFTPWPCKQTCFTLKRDTEGQEQTCSRSFKILNLLTVLWIRLKALGPGVVVGGGGLRRSVYCQARRH